MMRFLKKHPAQAHAPDASSNRLAPGGRWSPTHRHRKGGLYRVLGRGIWEADRSAAVIYDDAEGTLWIRPATEFDDGRFEPLGPATRE